MQVKQAKEFKCTFSISLPVHLIEELENMANGTSRTKLICEAVKEFIKTKKKN
ncbi:MAG: hypothetical protein WCK67_07995 [bacterium]